MEYIKYDMKYYNLHMIKTDLFKTIHVKVNFKRKINKEEITLRNFLGSILLTSSLKYPSKREIEKKAESLYNVYGDYESYKSGNYHILSFEQSFLNEKYTEDDMNRQTIQFLKEIIFNPNVVDNKFDQYSFDLVKRTLIEEQESIKENPSLYSRVRMYEEMDSNSILAYRSSGYREDLEQITPASLYEYYNDVLKNDIVDIFVIGNFDNEEMKEIITQNINITSKKDASDSHHIKANNWSDNEKIVKEKFDVNQSKLSIGFKMEEMDNFERQYALNVFSFILGGSSDSKLFKTVREKNSLCYYISSTYSSLYNLFEVVSGIDSVNFNQAVTLIKEAVNEIQNGEFDDDDIVKAKTTYISGCEELYDSPKSIIKNYLAHEYFNNDLLEDKIKRINEVTREMVISISKKIHLDTIFLLEGGNSNAEDLS